MHASWNSARPAIVATSDLVVAAALTLAAATAYLMLPPGNLLRLLLSLPILFVVPGYVLLQALRVGKDQPGARIFHVLYAIGLSPALVGLLALATALVPGGFKQGTIVAVVVLACMAAISIAAWRRMVVPKRAPSGTPADASA